MRICVDSGFLIGLCNAKDQHHSNAADRFSDLFETNRHTLVVPWPILYETIRTGTVRDRNAMSQFERLWNFMARWSLLELVSDSPYREGVIDACFAELGKPENRRRSLSAVDRVIRNILADEAMKIDGFLTFNTRDFVDVCRKFNRRLIS